MGLIYQESGNKEGETIIFIHACGVSSWMWYGQKCFMEEYRCIFLDMQEHGLNLNQGRFTIENSVNSIIEIIENSTKEKKAILIGHEMGARIVLSLLNKREDLVKKAILSGIMIKSVKEALFHKILPKKIILNEFNKKYAKLQNPDFQITACKAYGVSEEYRSNYLEDMFNYNPEKLVELITEGLIKDISLKGIERIELPVLVIVGAEDLKANIQSTIKLTKLIPNSIGFLVKNANQNLPRTNAEVFNKTIVSFLQNTDYDKTQLVKIERKK